MAHGRQPRQTDEFVYSLGERDSDRLRHSLRGTLRVAKEYSVAVNFISTGNEVDIVPILYDGDPKWRGELSCGGGRL